MEVYSKGIGSVYPNEDVKMKPLNLCSKCQANFNCNCYSKGDVFRSSCDDDDDVNEIEKFIETNTHLTDALDLTELKDLCIRNVPFWDDLKMEDICIRKINTALTNAVFKVELNMGDDGSLRVRKLLLRIILPHLSSLYDVESQSDVLEVLAMHNCAPKLLAKCDGARMEQWLDGYILRSDCINNPSVLTSMASLIAKFHKRATLAAPTHWDRTPFVIRTCKKWITKVADIINKKNLNVDLDSRIEAFNKYEKILSKYVKGKSFANEIMFCHNDVHLRNVIVTYHGYRLIDFEYSAFNYVGYDIGNMFDEILTNYEIFTPPYFEINYKYEISNELKCLFASVYLSEVTSTNILPSDKDIINEFLTSIRIHSLGPCIIWSLWGLIYGLQLNSQDTFDYIQYSDEKMKMFNKIFNNLVNDKIIDDV